MSNAYKIYASQDYVKSELDSFKSLHNAATDAHGDIRELITGLTTRLNALADSDDTTLDQLSEIVAYIKSNKSLIESVTTSKVSTDDIVTNYTTDSDTKVLAASVAVDLKALIDAIDTSVDAALSDESERPVQNKVVKSSLAANLSSAKTYTNEEIAKEVTARNEAIATAKTEATGYTDARIAEEVTARNEAIATAKKEATDHADTKAEETLKAAKEYADGASNTSTGQAEEKVNTHNSSDTAHADIRELITGLTTRLNALADSDDTTLDQLSEIVAYIKSNKELIDAITTSKVSVTDIVTDFTTDSDTKVLAASVAVDLKALIDALTTSLSDHAGNTTVHITADERTAWNNKADKVEGKGLSTNDLTDELKTNYDDAYTHSQADHARVDATKVAKSTINGNILVDEAEVVVYTHPGTGTNPHGTTKADVGLGNVDNTADTDKNVASAAKLTTARTITLEGDMTGSAEFDGSADITITAAASPLQSVTLIDIDTGAKFVLAIKSGTLITYVATESIRIDSLPTKISYAEGEALDTTGMVVIAVAEDGTERAITNYTAEIVNGTDIVVTYEEAGKTFTVTAAGAVRVQNVEDLLQDFTYNNNGDGTYTLTGWKETLNGEPSTEMVIPDSDKIIL